MLDFQIFDVNNKLTSRELNLLKKKILAKYMWMYWTCKNFPLNILYNILQYEHALMFWQGTLYWISPPHLQREKTLMRQFRMIKNNFILQIHKTYLIDEKKGVQNDHWQPSIIYITLATHHLDLVISQKPVHFKYNSAELLVF